MSDESPLNPYQSGYEWPYPTLGPLDQYECYRLSPLPGNEAQLLDPEPSVSDVVEVLSEGESRAWAIVLLGEDDNAVSMSIVKNTDQGPLLAAALREFADRLDAASEG